MSAQDSAFPLSWPPGWRRTPADDRYQWGHFHRVTMDNALRALRRELQRLGAQSVIISSNVPLRADGLPRGNYRSGDIGDPGVAVYFIRHNKRQALACDTYSYPEGNLRGLGLTLQAMRTIERYGAELLERAFTGFQALPPAGGQRLSAAEVMGFKNGDLPAAEHVGARFRELAKIRHPDQGGSAEAFAELVAARDELLRNGAAR